MSVSTINPVAPSNQRVTDALANASRETGVDFNYLLKTAERESSLNPDAKSKTSSACGLFQFIEQTWLSTLKAHGAEHGYAAEAALIETNSSGRLYVADPAQRQAVLSLRKDPEAASLMAAELTRESRDQLRKTLGRDVDEGELYLAHFMGPREAARFIASSDATPESLAADTFPKAAAANRSIFYDSAGVPRTMAAVKGQLTRLHEGGGRVIEIAGQAVEGVREHIGSLFTRTPTPPQETTASVSWMPPSQALTLTPQILQILSSLDPFPDARSAEKTYRSLLASEAR